MRRRSQSETEYSDAAVPSGEPLLDELEASERVVHRLESDRPVAREVDDNTIRDREDVEPGAVAVVTDRRLLLGAPDAPEVVAFRDVRDVTVERGWLRQVLVVRSWNRGTRRFQAARGQPVGEAADFLQRAAPVRQRVLAATDDAREHVTAVGGAIEDGNEQAAETARADARQALSLARRRVEAGPAEISSSLAAAISTVERDLERRRVQGHLNRGQSLAIEADARAGVDAWSAVEGRLHEARTHLETALRIAVEADVELVATIQAAVEDLDARTRSILARQRTLVADARDVALAADSPAAAVPALETALEGARDAATADWAERLGLPVDRAARRREAERVAGRLIAVRRRLAERQRSAAEWARLRGDRHEAEARYEMAAEQLRAAERLARELVAGDAERLAERRASVAADLAALRALADDRSTPADGPPQIGVNQSA